MTSPRTAATEPPATPEPAAAPPGQAPEGHAPAPRAPYRSPRLVRFGALDALTARVGTMGLRDKAGGGRNRTR
jgi:hypothetical protein